MSLRRVLAAVCLLISLACLAGGYVTAGYGAAAGFVLVPGIAGLFYRKLTAAWLLPACLTVLVGLAAAGVLLGAPALLMILGATAGLAAWDLANLDRTMEGSSPSSAASSLERRHIISLGAALGIGLLLATSALLLALRIPFVLLVLLVVLDLFCLDRAARYLRSPGR